MRTIYLLVRDEDDGEGYYDVAVVMAFSDAEVAKANLISLRQHASESERYEIEEIELIESVGMKVN